MDKSRALALTAFLTAVLLILPSCSEKKEAKLRIYSEDLSEYYTEAAKAHFTSVGWSRIDLLDDPLDLDYSGGGYTISVGGGEERYVVIVGGEETVSSPRQAEGRKITFNVCDDGSGDITIAVLYMAGTTENCVVQGNLTSGEMTVSKTAAVSAAGVTEPSERAKLIFDAVYNEIVAIEGK